HAAELAVEPDFQILRRHRRSLLLRLEHAHRFSRGKSPFAWFAGTIDRRLQATRDASANGLAIDAERAGNRRDRQSLSMKIKNHDDFPKLIPKLGDPDSCCPRPVRTTIAKTPGGPMRCGSIALARGIGA